MGTTLKPSTQPHSSRVAGLKVQKDPEALAAAREDLVKKGKLNPTADEIAKQAYDTAQKPFGTGGKVQRAISAVTAAVQGLSGGNVAQAISGASAPYLAEKIHELTTDANGKVNIQANLMAHAVLGAVTSYAAGNSALAGASGAVMGEYIAQQLYPGVKREDLSEEQRQTISALGTLAAGLAGGVVGDSTADVVAGAQAGKNAFENNNLALVARGCAALSPCRNKVAEQLLEIGAKAGITGLAGLAIKDVADKMTSDELEHLVSLQMMGNDEIAGKYLSSLQDKYAPSHTGGNQQAGTESLGKLENPVQDVNKGTALVTPNQTVKNSPLITISPETQPGKNDGIFINSKPTENTSTGYISESSDKNSPISASDFFKGTAYTDKVKQQASSGDFHSFPESVDGHADLGKISVITGGDGVERLKLEISGSYRGKEGVFEYIREPSGAINHRLFVPK